MKILIANPGTTSYKCRLYDMESGEILFSASIERIGEMESAFQWHGRDLKKTKETLTNAGYTDAVNAGIERMERSVPLSEISAIGFKTVLAKDITGCAELDEAAVKAMKEYLPLAPAHNMAYLDAIDAFKKQSTGVPLVGLFETAFHKDIPGEAYIYGIPYEYYLKYGIRKYGFHGASHTWVSERITGHYMNGNRESRIISCHLGGSSSVCAIKNGASIDTSMGMSPQCGLLNAKRVGDMDPFALLYLMEKEELSIAETRDILFSRSGIAGISGHGGDMRDIIDKMDKGDERAALAFRAFAYSVKRYIGEYMAALNGADYIAFTGGIGERSPRVREAAAGDLENLGIIIDTDKNSSLSGEGIISAENSPVRIAVLPANEEFVVARAVSRFIRERQNNGIQQ